MKYQPAAGDLELISSRIWRLENLYFILNEAGQKVKFKLNWAQRQLLDEVHFLNIILKARQMGFSTFIDIMMLDACLFNSDTVGAIIADTLPNARKLLRAKVLYAYNNMPKEFKDAIPTVQTNADQIVWKNGSSIECGTSFRGGTVQWLHISELGKIAARTPQKAKEIRSGALNTVAAGQTVFIESTAEGKEGVYYDMVEGAMGHAGDLSPIDFKFHFFPWWMDSRYQLEDEVAIPTRLEEYFTKLVAEGIKLTNKQKWWYVRKEAQQKDDMKREFPSFPEEAFEASMEGAFFSRYMAEANEEGRIGNFTWNTEYKVHTFWDIGKRDHTAIWFVQFINGWIYLVDHYETSGIAAITHFTRLLKEKPYSYGQHWFPHDIRAETWGMKSTRIEQLLEEGVEPEIVPNLSNQDQLESAYDVFPRCKFNQSTTELGRKCLRMFRKEWDDELGVFKKDYLHDWTADTAKAFMYMGVVYQHEDAKIVKDKPPLTVPSLATETFEQHLMIQKDNSWQSKRL